MQANRDKLKNRLTVSSPETVLVNQLFFSLVHYIVLRSDCGATVRFIGLHWLRIFISFSLAHSVWTASRFPYHRVTKFNYTPKWNSDGMLLNDI